MLFRGVHNFNPRSPWGERHHIINIFELDRMISIHAPRGGSDLYLRKLQKQINNFNPRSPWGERPARSALLKELGYISIHAPRGGSDLPNMWATPAL